MSATPSEYSPRWTTCAPCCSILAKLENVNNRVGRRALVIAGVIALIVGAVFAGQGANLIPGSSMTGDRMWLYIGLIVAIVGIILIVLGLRRPGHGRTSK
jgi:Kef-type K+ transport system membrane component KefB